MKIVHESIFASSLRAFFVAFFAVIGTLIALLVIMGSFYGLFAWAEEESLPTDAKVLTDASGSRKKLGSSAPVLLQINLQGEIGKNELTATKIEKILLKSHEDSLKGERVKGILLNIDSPGGGADDSDKIYRLLKEYKEDYQIPIYVYIDGMCASGGYYVACAGDKIYASPVSLIGSIGVLAWPPFVNVSETLEKIGLNSLTLFAGTGKDEMNPLRPWKPDEQAMYQKLINFYYTRFTTIVADNRPQISIDKLVEVYGARVFPSPEAYEHGFIDESGKSRKDVLRDLAVASGIPEDEKYQVVTFESKSWVDKWIKEESVWNTGKIKHELLLPSAFRTENARHFHYLFNP